MSIEEIQRKSQKVTNDSLDSTRRIATMAIEIEDTGANTLNTLDGQSQQLQRIENSNDEINNGLKRSEKNLSRMESLFCCIYWPQWLCSKKSYRDSNYTRHNAMTPRKPVQIPTPEQSKGHFIEKITNGVEEDEMENNLQIAVDAMVRIKQQALIISDTLDTNNEILNRINAKTESNIKRSQEATKRTHDLL
jgi:hypothetical protein